MQVLFGERIARGADLRIGCNGIIFDAEGRLLLTRRADNGLWCLPGGRFETGESVTECVEREVWEETGLLVRATHLVGVYSSPDRVLVYRDGRRLHFVALSFLCEVVGGQLGLSEETTEYGYFAGHEVPSDLLPHHVERVADAFAWRPGTTFVR